MASDGKMSGFLISIAPIKKKGASQIGFVMSFVIFILFLVFMYSAIQPVLKTQASKQSLLDFLRLSLLNNFYAEDLTIMTVNIDCNDGDCNSGKDCININRNALADLQDKENFIIRDYSGEVFNYEIQGNGILIGPGLDLSNDVLLKVYYDENLNSPQNDAGEGCEPVDDSEVIIGSVIEEKKQVIESNIFSLTDSYETGELKTNLGIAEGNDFTFIFEFANGTKIEPANVQIPDTNIYATTFPVQYLDIDANLKIGHLTIKAW